MAQELAEKWASSFEEILALNPRTRRITHGRCGRKGELAIDHVDYEMMSAKHILINTSASQRETGKWPYVELKHSYCLSSISEDIYHCCTFGKIMETISIAQRLLGREFYFREWKCDCDRELQICFCCWLEVIIDTPPPNWLQLFEEHILEVQLQNIIYDIQFKEYTFEKCNYWILDYLERHRVTKVTRFLTHKKHILPDNWKGCLGGVEVTLHSDGKITILESGGFPLTLQAWWVRVSYLLGGVAFDDVERALEGD